MLPYAYYLLKVIICSGVLFGYYWLLLRNKIFHGYNRFYLLATVVLSLVLPLIQINIWQSQNTTPQSIKLLTVVTGSSEYLDEIVLTAKRSSFTAGQFILIGYILTCLVFSYLFIKVLLNIRTLLKQHQHYVVANVYLVGTTAKGTPFSFFKYIFWNNNIDIATTTGNQIFKHELAHVQQKHSYDKLFINATLIFLWCNPFFWLVRKELNMIHEFMADKIAVEDSGTEAFAAMILQATYPQHRFPLTNSFFYSPIKRRLTMLTKNKNPKAGYIARILVLPLAVLLFAAFTLKTKTFKNIIAPGYNGKKITVVLDAGHGGKDFGATSPDGKIAEKDLALSISKKIKSLNNNDNVNIVLTRENDVYQSPQEKADFSKAQHADLFISVHMDAAEANSLENKTGLSVMVAKDEYPNSGNSKLFASSIIGEFSSDYKLPVATHPVQRQIGVWILQANECPSVLIQAGYITNKTDLAYLQTNEAKETIAKNILAAIEGYATAKSNNSNTINTLASSNDIAPASKPRQLAETKNKQVKLTNASLKNASSDSLILDKILIIVNGKRVNKSILKNYQIYSKKVRIYEANNAEAIRKYGPEAKNGVADFMGATLLKNAATTSLNFTASADTTPDNKIFTKVENEAKFPGGDSAWRKYLEKNLDPAIPVKEGRPEGEYKVIVTFIVKKDGSITDVTADNYKDSKMSQACIDLIKKGPKWEPAVQNNLAVNAYKKQPVTFLVQEQ